MVSLCYFLGEVETRYLKSIFWDPMVINQTVPRMRGKQPRKNHCSFKFQRMPTFTETAGWTWICRYRNSKQSESAGRKTWELERIFPRTKMDQQRLWRNTPIDYLWFVIWLYPKLCLYKYLNFKVVFILKNKQSINRSTVNTQNTTNKPKVLLLQKCAPFLRGSTVTSSLVGFLAKLSSELNLKSTRLWWHYLCELCGQSPRDQDADAGREANIFLQARYCSVFNTLKICQGLCVSSTSLSRSHVCSPHSHSCISLRLLS